MSTLVKIALVVVVGLAVLTVLGPDLQPFFTRLFNSSEIVSVPGETTNGVKVAVAEERQPRMVTLLGFDGIPAILEPDFVTAPAAEAWMEPLEPVLGLSINGDHRAYSVRMLSRHEIVNDVLGGVPVAVTW